MTRLINIDNGGTLTDICVVDGEEVRYTKTLTTPFDLSRCLFDGLAKASALLYGEERMPSLLQSTDYIRYSTTQGTNALVQRKGPRLGLLVTDPALIGRLTADPAQRELLDALVGDRWASVTLAGDEELSAELVTTINDLAGRGASRLVVSIGGEAGPAEERRIRGLLLRLYPRHLLGAVPLVFSWELLGGDRDDIRRTWSSLLNAFLHPAMERFLFNTQQRLREQRTRRPLLIFRNDGGSSRVSKSSAIKTYSSGPRGGLEGTRALAGHYGFRHLLMVDVGGTTTDIGAVTGGKVRIDRRGLIGGVPSSLPLAAIASHGVGGSSVIRVTDGRITVGPDSVGAAPGPACFGLGGTAATITDVYLLMGILDPATYLGGDLKLDTDRSAKAVTATIAEPLHVTLPEALALMEEAYVDSAAQALLADGPLPDDTVLAAFGGAGPMTICGAARQAGARRWDVTVYVHPGELPLPPSPGIWPSLHLDTAITPPVGVETYAAYALRAWLVRDQIASDRTRRFAKWPAICSFALGGGQVAYHLMTQAGIAQAPWPVTTLVSCLPVLVLAMGTALAHMLRADAEAVDVPDNRTRPRAVRRSPSRSAEDQDGPGRRQPEADRDRSVSRDQTGPKPGRQGGRGIRGPDPRPAQPQVEQARLVARRLATAGRPVSRRALRGAGVTGSNQALNALARRINAEQAGATPPEPISPG